MAYQPKSYKKFVATAATATLVATAVVPAAFADDVTTAAFTDVAPQYKAAVDFVVEQAIAKGISETQFGISKEIIRGDAAIMIANAAKLNDPTAPASGFTDVPTRGALAINSLKAAGVTNGKTATSFDFSGSITRGEAAVFLANAFDLKGDTSNVKFTDVNSRYMAAVAALVDEGVTAGKSATQFGTDDNITRGEFARWIFALEEYIIDPVEPGVASVNVVNAKELQIKFAQPVKESSVIGSSGTTLANGVFFINELTTSGVKANEVANADSLEAELSADGKTLTITADTFFDGRYEVTTVAEEIETVDGVKLPSYTTTVTANDTVKPTISGVNYTDNTTAVINFSEPLSTYGTTPVFKYADGSVANVTLGAGPDAFTSGDSELVLDLTNADANKAITVTFVGAADFNGNLISPNPASVTVKKDTTDTTAPTVTAVTPTSATSFQIRLSEAVVDGLGTITVGTTDVSGNATVDATDKTLVRVTGVNASVLNGLQTVSIASDAFKDLSGNSSAAFTRVVNFSPDTVDPAVQSVSVQNIDDVNYLVVNFSENVNALTGKTLELEYVNSVGETVTGTLTTNATAGTDGYVSLYNPTNGLSSSVKVDIDSLVAEDYTVDIPEGFATDLYGNDSDAKNNVTFSVSGVTSKQSVKTTVYGNGIERVSSDTLEVNFNNQLDIASATNASNYVVNGQVVESAKIVTNSAGSYVVELKLADGSVPLDGTYDVTVRNVSAFNGSVMNTYTTTEALLENVSPKVTSATLTAPNQVTVTFSEAVTNATADADDFELLIGGQTVAANNTVTTQAQGTADNTLVLTLEAAVTAANLTSGLSLELLDTVDVQDANTNVVSGPAVINVQQ